MKHSHEAKRGDDRKRPCGLARDAKLREDVQRGLVREREAGGGEDVVPCLGPEGGEAVGEEDGSEQGGAGFVAERELAAREDDPDAEEDAEGFDGGGLGEAL